MPTPRRPHLDERRRLVIYSQRLHAGTVPSAPRGPSGHGAAGRRGGHQAYGSRVHRRLRARWYGVVPVKRRTMFAFALVAGLLVSVLAVAHWAALWWEPLATRPHMARPLRLDRPDSFGAWLATGMLVLTAGLSLLVYQLRRYRSDDYHGHYRIWRIAILVCLLASLDGVVDLVAWLGAGLDVLLAEREILAGADWIRLLLCVGGVVLGIRMTAEVARDRLAMNGMLVAVALLAVPQAARWNFLEMETPAQATWLPIFAVAARAALLVAVMSYLRMLYREVRRLEPAPPFRDWIRGWVPRRPRVAGWWSGLLRSGRPAEEAGAEVDSSAPTRRRGRGARQAAEEQRAPSGRRNRQRKEAQRESAEARAEPNHENEAEIESNKVATGPGRWAFRWLRIGKRSDDKPAEDEAAASGEPGGRVAAAEATPGEDDSRAEEDGEAAIESGRRRRFRFGRKRSGGGTGNRSETPESDVSRKEDRSAAPESPGEDEPAVDRDEAAAERPKRRLRLWKREPKHEPEQAPSESAGGESTDGRRRFALRWPKRSRDAENADESEGAAARSAAQPRREPAQAEAAQRQPAASTETEKAPRSAGGPPPNSDDEAIDPDQIDWASLSKSERRRMRKLLKRQARAA